MRTTVDLPEDLHRLALAIAHDRGQTLSGAIADLLRMALSSPPAPSSDAGTGWPVVQIGRPVGSEDGETRKEPADASAP